MKRCFLALNLPDEIKAEFSTIQANLKQQNQGIRIAWVNPEIAHIKLHFLGDLDENGVDDLKDNLNALEAKYGPISLVLTGVGAFPGLKNPRVLFLGVKHLGENNLIKLYQDIGQILQNQNLKVEDRPFIAHMTLGRIKDDNKNIKIIGEEMPDIEFKVDSFELMQSVLTPQGPDYKIIQSYKL